VRLKLSAALKKVPLSETDIAELDKNANDINKSRIIVVPVAAALVIISLNLT
jgi:hypothetical protein